MRKLEIHIGTKFGRLSTIKEVEPFFDKTKNYRTFLCKCECGNELKIRLKDLRNENTTSCGCFKKEINSVIMKQIQKEYGFKHGDASRGTELNYLYSLLNGIKRRCDNPNFKFFKDYGGRGIDYDPRYKSYEIFKNDILNTIGNRPSLKHSLDRINNDKGYWINNLRWANATEQALNKRKKIKIK
jgi:hypothetical protein